MINEIIRLYDPKFKEFKRNYIEQMENSSEIFHRDGERKFSRLEQRYIRIIEDERLKASRGIQLSMVF
ncbi:MAG: hypothetical protein AAF391_07565 [Bacteroidota bacterium]